jgi:putative membrane protein
MMFWTDHAMTGWGWTAMTLSMLVFWALLIALTVVLVRTLGRPAEYRPRATPEAVLAERLARGEIDAEEYRQLLDVLRGSGHDRVPWPSRGGD